MSQGVLVALVLIVWIGTPFLVGWSLRHDRISERSGAITLLGIAPVSVVAYGLIRQDSLLLILVLAAVMVLPLTVMYRPLLTFMGDWRRRD